MRAVRLQTQGEPLTMENIPLPSPEPGEILVKLEACGVCHTDLHIRDGDEVLPSDGLPITLGHEGVGLVTAVGADTSSYRPGDRVGAPWLHRTCLSCNDCLTGHEAICGDLQAHGLQVDGAFAEYIVLREDFAVPIPRGMDSISAAPVLCAGATAYSAVTQADLRPGETCVIFGCGGLGQYAIQYANLTGAKVIAVDTDPARLESARQLGARHQLASDVSTGDKILELGGADACLNFAPTPAIWPAVEKGLNKHGRFISVAMPQQPVAMSLAWLTWIKPIITGAAVGSRVELRKALALAQEHGITVPIETVSLADVNVALDRLAGKSDLAPVLGRIVVSFQ